MTTVPKIYSVKSTPKETLEKWFRLITLGRAIDEKAPNYLKQAIGWSYHGPYAGHDGIQLAIGQIFEKNSDHIFLYYRDMLSALSCGMTAEELILNGISKATDLTSGGRHMSNHFAKPDWNIHNVSSLTGNHTLHAVGAARAIKYYGKKAVAISSQGESSLSEGYVYEAINGASKEQLPVIFTVQDNGYGISVPKKDQTANRKVANNFSGFKNLRIIHCNGKDVFDSMNAMTEAKRHAIEVCQPVIVQANCVRIHSHSNSDRHELYRSEAERSYSLEYDPVAKFRRMLLRYKRFTEDELIAIEAESKAILKASHKLALKAPDPDPNTYLDFVLPEPYISEKYPDGTHKELGEKKKLITALNETLKAEFRHNPDTFIWGQDMANKDKGGVFNVSKGMQQEFGDKRVFNAPIAEDFIVGTANGMSRFDEKIRIVVEGAEFADYFWPAMEQYVDSSHDYWRSNGKFTPNVTIRLASGGYIGGGLYHSQNLEGALTSIPGVRIVYPSFADDAAGLLRTAMRSRGLTMYMEPKALYNDPKASTVIPDDFEVPFGKARTRREGKDLFIITYGNTTHMCLEAAEKLAEEGIECEVLDLRSLIPLDKEAILTGVKKIGKVMVVHEDKVHSGFGAELAATIMEEAFEYLDGPVHRVGSSFTPVGFHRSFERIILPNTEKNIYRSKTHPRLLINRVMSKAIIYSFNSNKTAIAGKKILDAIGKSFMLDTVNAEEITEEKFLSYDQLILGVPTWFDGELPNYWDEFVPAMDEMDLNGKKIAIFGLADQVGYPENFADGVGIMARLLRSKGAEIIGQTTIEKYEFESSLAIENDKFMGLVLDQENQARLSKGRIDKWVEDLKKQF